MIPTANPNTSVYTRTRTDVTHRDMFTCRLVRSSEYITRTMPRQKTASTRTVSLTPRSHAPHKYSDQPTNTSLSQPALANEWSGRATTHDILRPPPPNPELRIPASTIAGKIQFRATQHRHLLTRLSNHTTHQFAFRQRQVHTHKNCASLVTSSSRIRSSRVFLMEVCIQPTLSSLDSKWSTSGWFEKTN